MTRTPGQTAFSCQRCGHCCHGEGGIVLKPRDIARLAEHLGLGPDELLDRYAAKNGSKPNLRTGPDGDCVFFEPDTGCGVHPARPDVCRAWPFFRGNLVDETSWEMIQEYCPGVNPEAGHAEFVRQGREYLARHGLLGTDPAHDPNALLPGPADRDED